MRTEGDRIIRDGNAAEGLLGSEIVQDLLATMRETCFAVVESAPIGDVESLRDARLMLHAIAELKRGLQSKIDERDVLKAKLEASAKESQP